MLTWIAAQIGFGNFMVGLGTMVVAAVSFYVASSANTYERRRVYVTWAGLWIEELRKAVAACIGTPEARSNATLAERQGLLPKLREQEIHIRMKSGQPYANARRLFPLLDQIRHDLGGGAVPVPLVEEQVIKLFREIVEKKRHTHTAPLPIGRWR